MKDLYFSPIGEDMILRAYTGNSSKLVIPDTYDGKPVTVIGRTAFSENDTLQEIVLPDSIEEIVYHAFSDCVKLEKINFPSSLNEIGEKAFFNCKSLTEITIPKNVNTIRKECFSNCHNLKKVTVENEDIRIGKNAFTRCSALEEVSHYLIEKLDLDSQINVLTNIFYKWDTLSNDEQNKLITLVNNKEKLKYEFVTIDDGNLFYIMLNKVISLTLYELDKYLNYHIQEENTNITAILLDYKNKKYNQEQINNYQKRKEQLEIGLVLPTLEEFSNDWTWSKNNGEITIYNYKGGAKSNVIPASLDDGTKITKITKLRELSYDGLETLTINAEISYIEDSLFENHQNLKKIILPKSLTEINNEAFKNCKKLSEVVLPENLDFIDFFAFEGCVNLTEIIIPKSVVYLGACTFWGCSRLKNVKILCDLNKIERNMFYGCQSLKEITIPASVKIIKEHAFAECYSLEKINFLGTRPVFGETAFSGCPVEKEVNS